MIAENNKTLYHDKDAARLKARTGEKYRPSNGAEGQMFMSRWCYQCQRDAAFRNRTGDSCPVVAATFCLSEDHPEYPPEWQYGDDGQPKCTAFEPTRPDDKVILDE